jgi:orotidine-5'-phosphate decarboxylase
MNKRLSKRVIVALDGMDSKQALGIARTLGPYVWGFKVNDLIYSDTSIVRKLKKYGKVFVDVKLHDIPNTVANSVEKISKLGADIITVHASGGLEMMKAAKKKAGKTQIIGVTVLTSSNAKSASKDVIKLTKEASKAHLDGVVCSGYELKSLKFYNGLKIVPGIRPNGFKKDDQKRIMNAKQSQEKGASLIIVGRAITGSKNVLKALENLLDVE